MSANSKIEWTDHTFNPWIGCTKVSPGCLHCYAETLMDTRYGRVQWGEGGTRSLTSMETWAQVLKWNTAAYGAGERRRVFCASLADIFEEWDGDMLDHTGTWVEGRMETWRMRVIALVMVTPHLDWQLLTKRPAAAAKFFAKYSPNDVWCAAQEWEREFQQAGKRKTLAGLVAARLRVGDAIEWVPSAPIAWPLPNLWIGTTVENQEMADKRLPHLAEIPAVVKFVSAEPLLEPVILTGSIQGRAWNWLDPIHPRGIHWVICGGESGKDARPMHPDWARGLRDQCAAAGVPFFFKQWGEWSPNGAFTREMVPMKAVISGKKPNERGDVLLRVGKKAAGRLLDGVEHNEFPREVRA